MSRKTFQLTVTVTAEEAPDGYTAEDLANDVRDTVFLGITEETPLDVVVMTVTAEATL